MTKKETTFSLKDQLFNKESVTYLADLFVGAYKKFDTQGFIQSVLVTFPELGLKERITHIAEQLYKYLPIRYEDTVKIILDALPPELDPTKNDNDFGQFIFSPLGTYIALYGCNEKHFDISRHALKECTKRFSVEFPIRTFINTFPKKMLQELEILATSDNYHQRRLVSEGSRITLPWGVNIVRTPEQILPLLDLLYADSTRYVTRSVANNMNGLSKINPDLVIERLQQRKKSGKQHEKEMNYIIKHSLRTLLKQGNTKSLEILGYHYPKHLTVIDFSVGKDVTLGEYIIFGFTLSSSSILGKCRIEYAVGYVKSHGKIMEKIFKIAEGNYSTKHSTFKKRHPFVPITTRAHYAGEHTLTIIVNGKRYDTKKFYLTV